MRRSEIYLSTDIEADGPIPGVNSMLSFASVAFHRDSLTPIASFSAVLSPLDGASQCPATMAWWAKNPQAWAAATKDPRPAAQVIPEYLTWLRSLPGHGKPVFTGYPVCYDFMWVYWYCHAFGQLPPGTKPPFGHSGLDIKTLAWVKLGMQSYHNASKRSMPKAWFQNAPKHTHDATADAHGQGVLLLNMLNDP